MKVELLHLTRVFQRGFKAVDDLSFSFTSGEVVGFVGPNGAGKTTTMRMLATLDVPDSGDILIDGKSILDDPSLAHRAVGFMPDDPSAARNSRTRSTEWRTSPGSSRSATRRCASSRRG